MFSVLKSSFMFCLVLTVISCGNKSGNLDPANPQEQVATANQAEPMGRPSEPNKPSLQPVKRVSQNSLFSFWEIPFPVGFTKVSSEIFKGSIDLTGKSFAKNQSFSFLMENAVGSLECKLIADVSGTEDKGFLKVNFSEIDFELTTQHNAFSDNEVKKFVNFCEQLNNTSNKLTISRESGRSMKFCGFKFTELLLAEKDRLASAQSDCITLK
ncbi:hypothetical protein [Silvanigrella aquatica]|uniref:Lipoprotein n=1 Tax=Silvanigrella aquatica TaxID=1915309 RepID=A0A1L4CXZ7_9BACT|nr:hypothetical protein [Silvanigrella aquatica]APJ02814.1 hypothetical protein AXG55_02310 [Silvanigrella aquatica]